MSVLTNSSEHFVHKSQWVRSRIIGFRPAILTARLDPKFTIQGLTPFPRRSRGRAVDDEGFVEEPEAAVLVEHRLGGA